MEVERNIMHILFLDQYGVHSQSDHRNMEQLSVHCAMVCENLDTRGETEEKIRAHLPAEFKVHVKSIVRIDCIHIINVRNALLKHITKTVNYVVLNCGVRPLNSLSPFS